ncbi:hypothetical protein VNO77_07393 [Canavalia gladiata]|uniref:Uncharacterized protein n=1 Tax=Canavalia gladiata TaxID=3824 RepID=A0AAN9QVT2_CANGL
MVPQSAFLCFLDRHGSRILKYYAQVYQPLPRNNGRLDGDRVLVIPTYWNQCKRIFIHQELNEIFITSGANNGIPSSLNVVLGVLLMYPQKGTHADLKKTRREETR